jgi:hypothetical protein
VKGLVCRAIGHDPQAEPWVSEVWGYELVRFAITCAWCGKLLYLSPSTP